MGRKYFGYLLGLRGGGSEIDKPWSLRGEHIFLGIWRS